MNRLQKVMGVLGLVAWALGIIWLGFVVPHVEGVSPRHDVLFSYMARSSFAEVLGKALVTESFIEHRHEHVVGQQEKNLTVEMVSTFVEILTDRLFFQAVDKISMDRTSRLIESRDALLFFPPGTRKKDYLVRRFPYLPEEGTMFFFQGEESIKGLRSYRFSFCAVDLDWSANYPDIALPEGSFISARDWGVVWIEPCTGIMVKHQEQWEAVVSGKNVSEDLVDAGSMWFLPDTITRQVFLASNEKRRLLFHKWIAPGTLFVMGIIFFFMARPARKGEAP